jgi:hypothetical protein
MANTPKHNQKQLTVSKAEQRLSHQAKRKRRKKH